MHPMLDYVCTYSRLWLFVLQSAQHTCVNSHSIIYQSPPSELLTGRWVSEKALGYEHQNHHILREHDITVWEGPWGHGDPLPRWPLSWPNPEPTTWPKLVTIAHHLHLPTYTFVCFDIEKPLTLSSQLRANFTLRLRSTNLALQHVRTLLFNTVQQQNGLPP